MHRSTGIRPIDYSEWLAKYMVAKYRLGYDILALYLAVPLFDILINSKLKNQNEALFDRIIADRNLNNLEFKINRFTSENIETFNPYTVRHILNYNGPTDLERAKDKLDKFRVFRNELVHSGDRAERELEEELVICLWTEFSRGTFERALGDRSGHITLDNILEEIRADYWVRQGDHIFKEAEPPQGAFCKILRSDFENLFDLRDQMEKLMRNLEGWLRDRKMTCTTLTTVDTATAYVWMPMVLSKFSKEEIPNIRRASVSITATPLDFRIHLDLGGHAIKDRRDFYQFLRSEEYRDCLSVLPDAGELRIFDTIWYTFIEREHGSANEIHQQDLNGFIKEAERRLANVETPLTWKRLLHGYILRMEDIPIDGISLDYITTKLDHIIKLYKKFLDYSFSN